MNATPPRPLVFEAADEEQTERLGRALADALQPGTVVALVGELGSGKTRLVRAVAGALGVPRESVSSPTFVLINEYRGRLPIYHIDTYRLSGAGELLDLGVDELFDGEGVCLIEWADRVAQILPEDHLRIVIEIRGRTQRRFELGGTGPASCRIVEQVRRALNQ